MVKKTNDAPVSEVAHDDSDSSNMSGITEDPFFNGSHSETSYQRVEQEAGGIKAKSKYSTMLSALQPTKEETQKQSQQEEDPDMKSKYSKMFSTLQSTKEESFSQFTTSQSLSQPQSQQSSQSPDEKSSLPVAKRSNSGSSGSGSFDYLNEVESSDFLDQKQSPQLEQQDDYVIDPAARRSISQESVCMKFGGNSVDSQVQDYTASSFDESLALGFGDGPETWGLTKHTRRTTPPDTRAKEIFNNLEDSDHSDHEIDFFLTNKKEDDQEYFSDEEAGDEVVPSQNRSSKLKSKDELMSGLINAVRSEHATGERGVSTKSSIRAGTDKDSKRKKVRYDKNVKYSQGNSTKQLVAKKVSTANLSTQQHKKTIDFLNDERSEMLYGRQIALYLMKRYKWYNPKLEVDEKARQKAKADALGGSHDSVSEEQADDAHNYRSNDGYLRTHSTLETTSLERAWAHFEHYTLARYIDEVSDEQKQRQRNLKAGQSYWTRLRHKFQKGDIKLDRASRGENILKTKLYHPVFTPHTQLGDWGIGWGLYFASVRAFAVIMFLAGLLNVPNFLYYASESYSVAQGELKYLHQGSAICTQTKWVPCPDCLIDSKINGTNPVHYYIEPMRLANHTTETGKNLVFALRNLCNGATRYQGLVNYGSLILILMGLVLFNRYVQVMEVYFDEDEQTTQDYSIQIDNPPPSATDPEEWRTFFQKNFNAHVTCCTVVVNNDVLIQKLVQRRENLRKIERMVKEGTPMDTTSLAGVVSVIERDRGFFGLCLSYVLPGIPELFRSVVVLTQDIRGLAQQEYPATKVFVTFEIENDQRRVLCDLGIGSLHVRRNDHSKLKTRKHLFRGKHMLLLSEPDEPDTMRWKHMNEKRVNLIWQVAITSTATMIAVFAAAQIVTWININYPLLSAITISGFNASFPYTAKFITRLEAHRTDTNVQTSMYCKIVFFRWVNTAIVYTLIKPFTSTISQENGLIEDVYNLFFSEIFTLNFIQLTDGYGNFLRHIVAPRVKTQDEMNLCFRGLEVELAERYTNMTKIVFLACWYSSIYPGGFFMSSIALAINYFTDRHSLMRTWYRAPQLGSQISEFSRKYFLTTVFVAMALLSSYFWSGFPFDNLCENETEVHANYTGTNFTFYPGLGKNDTAVAPQWIIVNETNHSFRFCHQDFFRLKYNSNPFPFISKAQPGGDEWMTPEQELLADLYGWTFVCVLVFMLICFVQAICDSILSMLYGNTHGMGGDQGIHFSSRKKIAGYIPQVDSLVYPYPLIVGSIESSTISYGIVDWTDPFRPHSYYDLTRDAEQILKDIVNSKVFSQVKHWPPPPEITDISKAGY